jgi:hypothetical protein
MKHLTDKKSWGIAFVESLGIFLFNAVFVPSFYHALGEQVATMSVIIVSAGLFLLRMIWFYLNLRIRLFLEKGRS